MESGTALEQVDLLKQSFLRLGGWNKDRDVYDDIVQGLKEMPEFEGEKQWKQLRLPSEWDSKEKPSDKTGKFIVPEEWEFVKSEDIAESGAMRETPSLPGMKVKRATSNWGLAPSPRFAQEDFGHGGVNGNANGGGPIGYENFGHGGTNGKTNGGGRIAGKKAFAIDNGEGYGSGDEEVVHTHGKSEIVY